MNKTQEEKLNILKNVAGEQLTTKELNNLGINAYYLKLFTNLGTIEQVSRGKYKIALTKEKPKNINAERYKYFAYFKHFVLRGKYVEAYEALMENYRLMNQEHNYDNHMRTYFILLRELIGSSYDFSPLDELYEFSEEKHGGYYDDFISFRESLMESDFYKAKMHLDKFIIGEKKSKGENNTSSLIFNALLEDVLRKIESTRDMQGKKEAFSESYKNLTSSVINKDYQAALKYVKGCIFYSNREKMSNVFKRIRDVINDIIDVQQNHSIILPKEFDYSKLSNVYGRFLCALNFRDYFQAQKELEEIMENDNRGTFRTIKRLIDDIVNLIAINDTNKKQIPVEDANVDQETLKKVTSPLSVNQAYQAFLSELEKEHYESSLHYLEICMVKNTNALFLGNYKKMHDMLGEIINMIKNKHGFKTVDIDYVDCEEPIQIFNKALRNKDYKVAFQNCGKVTYQNKSETLALFKKILYLMYEIDKKYAKKDDTKSKETIVNKEVNEKNIFTVEYFKDKITNGKYDGLFNLLQAKSKKEQLNRLEHVVLKLIKIRNAVLKGCYIIPEHVYTSNEFDYLSRFFEAIRCEDIYTAYDKISDIYEYAKNPEEFEIFESILRDIIKLYEKMEKDKNLLEVGEKILSNMSKVIGNKNKLSTEDINSLSEYAYFFQDNSHREASYIILGIIEFINLANKQEIDFSSFNDLSDDVKNLNNAEKVIYFLRNGNYISALENIKYLGNEFTGHEKNIIKKLLIILDNTLRKPRKYLIQYEDIPTNYLNNIKKLVDKYDFYGAYKYIVDNDLNDEILKSVSPMIFDAMKLTLVLQERLYQEFNEFINKGMFDEARRAMLNYEEKLDNSSLGCLDDLQEKCKEMKMKLKK